MQTMAGMIAVGLTGVRAKTGASRISARRRGRPNAAPGATAGCSTAALKGSTTGQLLVEVGRFAAENMVFRQKGNKAAARRARKHLSLIMKLAKQRRAEISAEIKGMSASPGEATTDEDDDNED